MVVRAWRRRAGSVDSGCVSELGRFGVGGRFVESVSNDRRRSGKES